MLKTVPHNRVIVERCLNGWFVQEVWDEEEDDGTPCPPSIVNQFVFNNLEDLVKSLESILSNSRPPVL